MQCPRVLILGAGFAGIGVAHELRRHYKPDECEITIVDENNFSLYTPMLAEAAGGSVDAADIVAPIRSLFKKHVNFEQARVEEIDAPNRRVTIAVHGESLGIGDIQRTLECDHLVIALGSITNYRNIPGLEENSLPAKTVSDALAIRNRGMALLERADEEPDPEERRGLLTFVVGGGGFSGVETMAALNDMVRDLCELYPNISQDDIRSILVHPGDRILPELSESLGRYAQRELEKRNVEIMLDTVITAAGPDWVEIKGRDGNPQRIREYTLIWTGGVMPTPVVQRAGVECGKHGGIIAEATCAVPEHPGVWALGDCAEVPQPDSDRPYAPTAQNAIREGKRVARNIQATMNGQAPEPFIYKAVGELAIVGKRSGVARLYSVHLRGILAWAMWRSIYLAKLPSMAQRFRVGLDWSLDLLFGRDIAQLPGVNPEDPVHKGTPTSSR